MFFSVYIDCGQSRKRLLEIGNKLNSSSSVNAGSWIPPPSPAIILKYLKGFSFSSSLRTRKRKRIDDISWYTNEALKKRINLTFISNARRTEKDYPERVVLAYINIAIHTTTRPALSAAKNDKYHSTVLKPQMAIWSPRFNPILRYPAANISAWKNNSTTVRYSNPN